MNKLDAPCENVQVTALQERLSRLEVLGRRLSENVYQVTQIEARLQGERPVCEEEKVGCHSPCILGNFDASLNTIEANLNSLSELLGNLDTLI